MDPVIVTEEVTKRFGSVVALDRLSLEVPGGQVVGFLGPNGAGKSTTIRLLLDLARPDAGRIEVLGVDPRCGPEVRRRIGYVPGELRLDDRLTVEETLRSWGRLRGRLDLTRAHELCERLALPLDRRARGLSGGNRRKVGLVGAFMAQPDLLILDEPTGGLDPLVQAEFQLLLAEATDAGGVGLPLLPRAERGPTDRRPGRRDPPRTGRGRGRRGRVAPRRPPALHGLVRRRSARSRRCGRCRGSTTSWSGAGQVDGVVDGSPDGLVRELARHHLEHLLLPEPDLEQAFLSLYEDDAAEPGEEA